MMTEEDARKRWCPFVRVPLPGMKTMSCIGSACMAWRWNYNDEIFVPEGMAIPEGYYAFATSMSSSGGNITKFNVCRLTRYESTGEIRPQRGSCGLAGAPT